MNTVHIVAGPTGSGKTNYALELARQINGELISADSRQIYKYLDVGTNKGEISQVDVDIPNWQLPVFELENSGINIYLLSFVDPDQNFTVTEFVDLANSLIPAIFKAGKTPILVGGTGLYIHALMNPEKYEFITPPNNELRRMSEQMTTAELQQLVPDHILNGLNNSDRNNPRRLIRLLEKQFAATPDQKPLNAVAYTFKVHYMDLGMEQLEEKLRNRANGMVEEGIIDETKMVLGMGFNRECAALQGIGYRQALDYLDGKITSTKELADMIYIAHRQYAKKQITWFKKYLS